MNVLGAALQRDMAKFDWDDLRYILAVAAAGSLAGAARNLGVNHTTVLRRIGAFETKHGLRLFERLPSGYELTAGGEELIATARRIDATVTDLERKLAGQDLRLSGTVRVTTTDTLMGSILPEILKGFHAAHPGITIEIAISNAFLNLTRRDADVAIRPAKNPPETLVGRRIAKVAFAIYGERRHLGRRKVENLAAQRWILPDDSLAGTAAAQWLAAELPEVEVALRTDSFLAAAQGARAGIGLAVLPCYLGDSLSDLVRVEGPVAAMETALWILTHEDLKPVARIRAFTDFAADALKERRVLLEGGKARR